MFSYWRNDNLYLQVIMKSLYRVPMPMMDWIYSKAEFFPDLATKKRYYSGNDTYQNTLMIRMMVPIRIPS